MALLPLRVRLCLLLSPRVPMANQHPYPDGSCLADGHLLAQFILAEKSA
jgi:hypothetical protein